VSHNSVTPSNVVALWQRRDAMINPVVSDLIRYWEGLRQGADVPRRADVDPREIREALTYSFILDHIRPGTVRFRLAGQHLTELMGMDVRGMPLRSFFELSDRKRLMEHVEIVFEGPCSLDIELVSDAQGRAPLDGRMILMPLKDSEGRVSRALGIMVTDGVIGLPPRRFRIRRPSLHPIQPGKPVGDAINARASGFAEGPLPYDGPEPTPRPRLTLLDGGKH
jgi:hypothetical protein